MRLIDADKITFFNCLAKTGNAVCCHAEGIVSKSAIEMQPTVDAEPVRHGHWEWNDYGGFGNYHCTVCRHIPYGKFSRMHRLNYMYCPYCGAKMDEEKENE